MNTEILKRLSVEQLKALEKAVKEEINARIDYRIIPGRKGTFISSKSEKPIRVIVQRMNTKTVSCIEEVNPTRRWNISPEFLQMDGVPYNEPQRREPPRDISKTYDVQTW